MDGKITTPLYLWKLEPDLTLKCYECIDPEIVHYTRASYFRFKLEDGSTKKIECQYLNDFKYDRVLSGINDRDYIKDIVSRALFRKMLVAQEAAKLALDKFSGFKENNQ